MRTVRPVGVPSSSTLSEPRRFGIVPSSTTVTSAEATFCPMRPAKAEVPLRLKSPSRPCPMASCRRMPGQPGPNTTVIEPAGASTAPSLSTAWRAASAAKRRQRPSSRKKSKVTRPPPPYEASSRLPPSPAIDVTFSRVGVAGPGGRLGPHAGTLAHVTRRLFDCAFLENQLFVDTVLKVNVGIVDLADQIAAEDSLHEIGRDAEAIGKEALGTGADEICHWRSASRAVVRANPIVRPSVPQAFWIRLSYLFILPVA